MSHEEKELTPSHAQESFQNAQEKFRGAMSDVKEGIKEGWSDVEHEAHQHWLDAQHAVESFVKLHPFKSLGFAAMAGALLALIIKR